MNATMSLAAILCATTYAYAGEEKELLITSVAPSPHTVADAEADIVIEFDQSLSPASVTASPNHFHVFGEHSGPAVVACPGIL